MKIELEIRNGWGKRLRGTVKGRRVAEEERAVDGRPTDGQPDIRHLSFALEEPDGHFQGAVVEGWIVFVDWPVALARRHGLFPRPFRRDSIAHPHFRHPFVADAARTVSIRRSPKTCAILPIEIFKLKKKESRRKNKSPGSGWESIGRR